MATPSIGAEGLARLFHDTYERLAPAHGYETRAETRQFDPDSPNGRLMIATCGAVLEELARREPGPGSVDTPIFPIAGQE